jgi:glutaredoxin-related protein
LKVGTKCIIFHLKFKGKVVGKNIASVNHASKRFKRSSLARLCGLGRQMVMVTKVYKPNVKLMVEELEQNPNVKLWLKHVYPQWPTRPTSYANARGW